VEKLVRRDMASDAYKITCEGCGSIASVWERERTHCIQCKALDGHAARDAHAERVLTEVFGHGELPL